MTYGEKKDVYYVTIECSAQNDPTCSEQKAYSLGNLYIFTSLPLIRTFNNFFSVICWCYMLLKLKHI